MLFTADEMGQVSARAHEMRQTIAEAATRNSASQSPTTINAQWEILK